MKKLIVSGILITMLIAGCSKVANQTGTPDPQLQEDQTNSQIEGNIPNPPDNPENDSTGTSATSIAGAINLDTLVAGYSVYPSITSVVASPTSVSPGGKSTITATPSSTNKVALTYTYLPQAGRIDLPYGVSGTRIGKDIVSKSKTVIWTLPTTPGTYSMKIIGDDGTNRVLRTIYVKVNTPTVYYVPVINNLSLSSLTIKQGDPVIVTVLATDPNKETMKYAFTADGTIALTSSPNAVKWTPTTTLGVHTIKAIVSDSHGSVSQNTSVTVILKNNAPVINSLVANSTTITPGLSTKVTVQASDPNGDTLAYSFSGQGTIEQTGSPNVVTWTPPTTPGNYSIKALVADSEFTVSKSISATVLSQLNTPPQISSVKLSATTITAGQSTAITVTASDPDSDSLGYTFSGPGTVANGSQPNLANWTPPVTPGSYLLTVKVSDASSSVTASATVVVQALPQTTGEVRAFPGAEGFGAKTRGAFGNPNQSPVILKVSNLNNSGTGSLRWALEYNAPRIVIFTVGGTIRLTGDVSINSPYITVAGQTAPGGGIAVRNAGLRIRSHDIILRGLKWRSGRGRNLSQNEDCFSIENSSVQPYNIIIDHNSLSWASDEIAVSWFPAHDITWQWNIISEGLMDYGGHGFGLLAGNNSKKVSIHHNLFAHLKMRLPECNDGSTGEIVNNVMYHWTNKASDFIGSPNEYGGGFSGSVPSYWNVVKNFYKRKGTEGPAKPIEVFNYPGWNQEYYVHANSRYFLSGNIGPNKSQGNVGDDWSLVTFVGGGSGSTFKSSTPVVALSGIYENTAEETYTAVLNKVGAFAPVRDAVDTRIINDVKNGTGALKNSVSDADYPYLSPGTTPADSDNDGLPDSFEQQYSADRTSLSTHAKAPSGYNWIEEYINSFIK
ncbi:MAG TPA: hypothetical protein DF296_01945 [Candidatus Margulisbacteria bacterium]|nr:MAG: hypothetical protein A2X42_03325 [Candidatus Margulisbacteria bacterium GWF2_38_17]OGI06623.1 MAG: hypothetical protein A2X41_05455 [Candidatus Margulisbacteria bacterium GWE2_39_32]HCT83939.1 hypothetical protein [Candidatus Margulisiibacteriota bacterium]